MKTEMIKKIAVQMLAAWVLVIGLTAAAQAAVLRVTKIADTNDGACNFDCSLREAIAAAAAGDTIIFASPLFDSPQAITLSGAAGFRELLVNKNLTITGRGARMLTIRRLSTAASEFRIFNLADNTVVAISDLTVTGGRGGQGGGIFKGAGGSLRLDGVSVRDNRADGGGGLDTSAPTTITNSTFSGNSALNGNGGGISVGENATANIANSTFSGNSANPKQNCGGGIFNIGMLTLNNVTVAFNSALAAGGVCTITANVRNSIIASNSAEFAPDAVEEFNSLGNNLIGNTMGNSGFGGSGSNDKVNVAANLAALANNGGQTDTHALLENSPAIDAGNGCVVNSSCASFNPPQSLTTDQRGAGFSRRVDLPTIPNTGGSDGTDIGAFELQSFAPTAATVSIGGRVLASKGRGLMNARVTLTDQNGNSRTVLTSTFGYYRFSEVEAGQTYILQVISKRYIFAPQIINVTEEIEDLNFIAVPLTKYTTTQF